MTMKIFPVSLPQSTHDRLQQAAAHFHQPMARLIRMLLVEGLVRLYQDEENLKGERHGNKIASRNS